jgi:hypothetical protein
LIVNTIHSNQRNKVGYIDMEYILQNVPNYAEANTIRAKSENKKLRPKKSINKIKEAR